MQNYKDDQYDATIGFMSNYPKTNVSLAQNTQQTSGTSASVGAPQESEPAPVQNASQGQGMPLHPPIINESYYPSDDKDLTVGITFPVNATPQQNTDPMPIQNTSSQNIPGRATANSEYGEKTIGMFFDIPGISSVSQKSPSSMASTTPVASAFAQQQYNGGRDDNLREEEQKAGEENNSAHSTTNESEESLKDKRSIEKNKNTGKNKKTGIILLVLGMIYVIFNIVLLVHRILIAIVFMIVGIVVIVIGINKIRSVD